MMLAKIESWEQKKNIMLNDDLTKEEMETQKKLREVAREERDSAKRKERIRRRPGEKMYKEKVNKKRKMIAVCRGGDEERENRNGKEGEEREKVQEVTRGQDLTGSNPKAVISSSAALALAAATLAHFRDRDANANRRQIRLDVASVYVPTPLIQQTVPND
ncbi:hypothetical protein GEV33_002678 [Tenebrio molitor]|uniref:Uncharacterized protein n=1 Tax=Tenebrio molitor TaxID=7067 RepID=A0A8J6HSZ6_TENMO|nr:hypothetical protein GEV33_002678 [Tenebrio molitor]